jgi:hypothetical protein
MFSHDGTQGVPNFPKAPVSALYTSEKTVDIFNDFIMIPTRYHGGQKNFEEPVAFSKDA